MKTYKVEITEEFIKEAHAVACDEWKIKIENLVPDAFKPEAGEWYKHKDRIFFITEFDEEGHAHGYGIGYINKWLDAKDVTLDTCICNEWFLKYLVPATEKEVEDMLTEEAERRGLVKGVEVKSLLTGYKQKITNNYGLINNNLFVDDTVNCSVCIFSDGEWAKPIKTEVSATFVNCRSFEEHYFLKTIEALETELAKLKSEL